MTATRSEREDDIVAQDTAPNVIRMTRIVDLRRRSGGDGTGRESEQDFRARRARGG